MRWEGEKVYDSGRGGVDGREGEAKEEEGMEKGREGNDKVSFVFSDANASCREMENERRGSWPQSYQRSS